MNLFADRPGKPKSASRASVRLMPAVMATAAVLLGLKAVAVAESVAETTAPAADHAEGGAPAGEGGVAPAVGENQCAAPSLAEMAGLSAAEVQVLQALSARREALDVRAEAYDTQDELVMAAERRLVERLAELRELESTVQDLLGQLDEAQETRLASLVDVYQRMRAKDAAAVFDGLEDDVLIQVASRMRQGNLAEIMGRMDPQRARRLTEMLALRARPPAGAGDLLARGGGATPAPVAPAATGGGG